MSPQKANKPAPNKITGEHPGAAVKEGWEMKTLEEISTDFGRGKSKHRPRNEPRLYGGKYPFIQTGDIRNADHVVTEYSQTYSEIGLAQSKIWPAGTICITIAANIAETAILGFDACFPDSVIGVVTDPQLADVDYVEYLLQSFKVHIQSLGKGSAQANINMGTFENQRFPFPPLPEQKRIVALLDEAFAGIATAKANAEKNLQNARALFESHLQAVFTQRGADWIRPDRPLSDLCELIVDCEHKTAPTQDEGVPSIRTPNIGKGRLLLDGVNRVSEETYKIWTRRAEPLPGDLILAREAPAGNVAVIPSDTRVCLGQRTVLIRPRQNIFEPSFLAYLLLEPSMQETLLAHSRGATVQHVNLKDIRALDIGSIPSIEVQRLIATRINAITGEGDRLASIYEKKIAALDALKKALLRQAFSGELSVGGACRSGSLNTRSERSHERGRDASRAH